MKPTILVIEDENGLQDIVKIIFERNGYEVLQARTLVEAKNTFDSHKLELAAILMDRYLDSETTDFLLLSIRKSGFLIPIVAFAGTDKSQIEQMSLGCSHRLPKPTDENDYINLFNSIIPK